ncbi:MAG: hypothetical protein EXS08_01280 [Planctomycetes bacterium]|nr:hypothetical protein [Planctomycetota bacterium]
METGTQASPAKPPRVPLHLVPALLALSAVGGLAWAHSVRLALGAPELAPGQSAWIDPAEVRVVQVPAWADPRWIERLQARLAEFPPFEAGRPQGTLELAADLARFSFVERVERCEADPDGGLAIELVLREPVACIPVRGAFALVDEDGVVLEGLWPLPPRLGRAFLPVLGPLEDPLFARARAGDWLVEPEHRDALDVALSLAQNLGEDERAELGRIWIDAREARGATVQQPGVRLELEGERSALFGRTPSSGEPGELSAAAKWSALSRALRLFASDPARYDWERVDLRWDRPDLALRNAPTVASVEPAATGPHSARVSSGHSVRAADDGRPRVR